MKSKKRIEVLVETLLIGLIFRMNPRFRRYTRKLLKKLRKAKKRKNTKMSKEELSLHS